MAPYLANLTPFLCGLALAAPALRFDARQEGSTAGATVTIDSGVVQGIQTSVAKSPNVGPPVLVNKYLGLPYAASPTRFAPAQTATPWSEPYMATSNGPACIQQFNYPEATRNFTIGAFNTPAPPESEDCLSVNVFTPAQAQASRELRPVMFWIYGGSLQFGYNGQAAYDGSSFAANQDVVIVAVNYRTNVFGFPASPSLPSTGQNLGWLDQRFALAWVQRNIAAFGGDPSRVTIFGESAGGFSVDALVTSFGPSAPDGPPPFQAAIMESGVSSVSIRRPDSTAWTRLIDALNCTTDDDVACARAVPATTLKNIIERGAIAFRPTPDNYTLPQYPETARLAGQIAQVPIMLGTNANEGIIFTFTQNNTEAWLRTTLNATDTQIQAILAAYPIGQRGINSVTSQISRIYTEVNFQCPSAIVANDTATGGIPVHRYFYNASFAAIQPIPGVDFGAYHASEIPLVYGNYQRYGEIPEGGKRLSELMQSMWATFAKNPVGGPAPGWSEVGDGAFVQVIGGRDGVDSYGRLRRDGTVGEIDGQRCDIWRPAYGVN